MTERDSNSHNGAGISQRERGQESNDQENEQLNEQIETVGVRQGRKLSVCGESIESSVED